MKSPATFLALILLILLSPALIAQKPSDPKDPGVKQDKQASHLGTWKLVSTKYGDAKDFTPYREESSRLKIINATHFIWVEVDSKTKNVLASAGGAYKLDGLSYTETIDFAGEGMAAYLGKSQKFTIRVDGDKLFQSGELSDGLKIEENWERVK